jgi:predicted metal-binding membrane protein
MSQMASGDPQVNDPQANAAMPGAIRLFARPKVIAIACVIALCALGWAALALIVTGAPGATFDPSTSGLLPRLVDALCNPAHAHPGLPAGAWTVVDAALAFLMWCAMALAMMLPTAAPMITTYAEIAETAARKGERIVSPLVIAGGYAAVWIGFAAAATALQGGLARAGLLDPAFAATGPLPSGALFVLAGLYQFSSLKHACLTQCQQPFPFFFRNWQTAPAGVFRLGLRQGLYCLGCCWAMMLLMFAVGVMNVVWMAGLGIIMAIEKIGATTRFTKLIGVAMIAAGVVLIARAVAAQAPF